MEIEPEIIAELNLGSLNGDETTPDMTVGTITKLNLNETLNITTTTSQPLHAHHWRIAEPEGPTSQGICVGCHSTREFRNYSSHTDVVLNSEHRLGIDNIL